MRNQLTLILISFLLISVSIKTFADEVSKIEIIIYSDDGVEKTVIGTNALSENLLIESFKPKKQSNYYISSGFGKIKNDIVGNFSAGYQIHPNLSIEGGIITSAEVYSVKSTSTAGNSSGTAGSKPYTITNTTAGLKVATNTSYLIGVNYSVPLINLDDLVPMLQLDRKLNFYTRGGILFWGVDYSLTIDGTITFDGATYSPSGSIPFANANGSDLYYGFGVSYPLRNNTSIRADYTKTKIAGVNVGGFTGSAIFQF
jgi:hypothetical protein